MLTRLLRAYLRRYRTLLLAVGALQFVQVMASLFLPTLNAKLIDNGIATGNTAYIWKVGGVMLGVTMIQVTFAIGATYFSARTAMGFGRDVRAGLFHQVTDFSAQEVNHFGAPSLITRITNDVQQVQMLVLMSCTLLVAAPITIVGGVIMAMREDGGLSLILAVSVPVLVVSVGLVVFRMVPQFQHMQVRIDRVNQVLREQITGMRVVRACGSPTRCDGSEAPTPISPRRRCAPVACRRSCSRRCCWCSTPPASPPSGSGRSASATETSRSGR
jgi:ATP-binding cassette subfamily B multidrug efflux pump